MTEIAIEYRNSKVARRSTSLSGWKRIYVLIVMVSFYIPLRCWLELFMLYREYMSIGENLHFLSEMCEWKVCLITKRRMANEMQGSKSSVSEDENV